MKPIHIEFNIPVSADDSDESLEAKAARNVPLLLERIATMTGETDDGAKQYADGVPEVDKARVHAMILDHLRDKRNKARGGN